MTANAVSWVPYADGAPPRSHGGVTLAEVMRAYCDSRLFWGDEVIAAMLQGDGTGPVGAVRDAVRTIGEAVTDGRLRTWARPIGGGEVTPLAPAMWEIDDYGRRIRMSALNLERWADQEADLTHWIFVDAADARTLVEQARREDADGEATFPSHTPPTAMANGPETRSADFVNTPAGQGPSAPTTPPVQAVSTNVHEAPTRARRLLKVRDVTARTRLSRSRIYEKMKAGTFPDHVKMGTRATAWYEDEVDDWIASPR